jgi:hypothetical protein
MGGKWGRFVHGMLCSSLAVLSIMLHWLSDDEAETLGLSVDNAITLIHIANNLIRQGGRLE